MVNCCMLANTLGAAKTRTHPRCSIAAARSGMYEAHVALIEAQNTLPLRKSCGHFLRAAKEPQGSVREFRDPEPRCKQSDTDHSEVCNSFACNSLTASSPSSLEEGMPKQKEELLLLRAAQNQTKPTLGDCKLNWLTGLGQRKAYVPKKVCPRTTVYGQYIYTLQTARHIGRRTIQYYAHSCKPANMLRAIWQMAAT